MKVSLMALLLLVVLFLVTMSRRRAAREAEAASLARARTARKPHVPTVSNNVKGMTATQTINPVKPGMQDDAAD